jgi:hypothetical protein
MAEGKLSAGKASHPFQWFYRYLSEDQGLSFFLVLLVTLLFVINPFVEFSSQGRNASDILFSLLLLWGAMTIRKSRLVMGLVIVVVTATFAAHWIKRLAPGLPVYGLESVLSALSLILFIVVILLHVFQPGPMTLHRVLGAVSVYLLLGMVWAIAFRMIAHYYAGSFHFEYPPLGEETLMSRMVYFSFETLTTVGFGDITAVHPFARALVVSEALVGQLFPVLLIGGLLSMALQGRDEA